MDRAKFIGQHLSPSPHSFSNSQSPPSGQSSYAMQLALVHDWLNQIGGAEAVLETMLETFPGAPIYTSIYWRAAMPPQYQGWDIHPLWLDRAPGIHQHHQPYLPLYPVAWSSLNLSKFDVILSNKSGFCHGVHKKSRSRSALHICYCLAATRYVWT